MVVVKIKAKASGHDLANGVELWEWELGEASTRKMARITLICVLNEKDVVYAVYDVGALLRGL